MMGLILSGLTAIPLIREAELLNKFFGNGTWIENVCPSLANWITLVHQGIQESYLKYPFLTYGNDWLAFGHFAIAVAFIGVLIDPIRNKWVVDFGIIICLLVIPYALIFGAVRDIPFWWRVIDSIFGIVGLIPLSIAKREIGQLIKMEIKNGI
jgi:hypothetical protein